MVTMLSQDLRTALHAEKYKTQPLSRVVAGKPVTLTYEITPSMSIDVAVENAFRLFCQTYGTTPDLFLSAKNALTFVAVNTPRTHTYVQYVNVSGAVGENQILCVEKGPANRDRKDIELAA